MDKVMLVQKDWLNVFHHVVCSIWAAGFKNAFYEESDRFLLCKKNPSDFDKKE